MSTSISKIAFALSQQSKASNQKISLGHCHQLVAALFGFKTLAAYEAAIKSNPILVEFSIVKQIICDANLLSIRLNELRPDIELKFLGGLIKVVFAVELPKVKLKDSLADVIEEYMIETMQYDLENDELISSEIAMANIESTDTVEFVESSEEIAEAILEGKASEVNGVLHMNADIERPFAGDEVKFKAEILVSLLGERFVVSVGYRVLEANLSYDW